MSAFSEWNAGRKWPAPTEWTDEIEAAFNAGLEAAAKVCEEHLPKPFTMGGIIERAQCVAVIRALKEE